MPYDAPGKPEWRRRTWEAIASATDPQDAQALLMPWKTSLELDAAVQVGFRPENLHAVDKDPELFVWPWRQKYPQIPCYVGELEDVCAVIKTPIHAASFDMCGGCTRPTQRAITGAARRLTFASKAAVGLNILLRHTNDDMRRVAYMLPKGRLDRRLEWMVQLFCIHSGRSFDVLDNGRYRTDAGTMIWTVGRLV